MANGRKCQNLLFTRHNLLPPFPELPFSLLSVLSCGTEKQISSNSLSSSVSVTPRLVVCVWCVLCNASAAPWISVVSRGTEGPQLWNTPPSPLVDILGQWSTTPSFIGWVSAVSSSQSAEQPARNNQPPNSLTAPGAWTAHQHPLPCEMGNMILTKVENWEACWAVCSLVQAGVEMEMETVPQSCNTVTGRQDDGGQVWF